MDDALLLRAQGPCMLPKQVQTYRQGRAAGVEVGPCIVGIGSEAISTQHRR